jgi:hypothetical protein
MPFSKAFFTYPFGSPIKDSPPGSSYRAPVERDGPFPEPSFHFFSKIPVNGTTLPQSSLTRHLRREKHFSRTFFNPYADDSSFPQSPRQGSPPMFHIRVPMERDVPSPSPVDFSFIYVCQSQKRRPPTKWGKKNLQSPSRSPTQKEGYIPWRATWFPKEIFNDTAINTPVPRSLQQETYHLFLCRQEPLWPASVLATLHSV